MKYFVTGATGFVGGRVVRQLVEAGHQVVVIVRNPNKAADLVSLGLKIHKGDGCLHQYAGRFFRYARSYGR